MSNASQRVIGAVGLALSLAFVIWQWQRVAAGEALHEKAAFLFPAFAVIFLALLLFPVSRAELMERYGVERPSSLNHYSLAQKAMFVLSFVAGALNWALLSGALTWG